MRWFDVMATLMLTTCISSSMALADDVSLYKKKGCAGCHGGLPDVEVIKEAEAPLIDQVAKKYRGQPDVDKMLLEQIIKRVCKSTADKDCHPSVKINNTERLRLIRYMLAH